MGTKSEWQLTAKMSAGRMMWEGNLRIEMEMGMLV